MSATGTPARCGSPSGVAGEVHDAAHALRHQVVAGARGIGAGLAEAGDRAIDQAGVFLAQAGIIETELGKPADLEILDQHVRARRELAHDAAPFLALEIELDRALAAIGSVEIGGSEMAAVGRLDEGRSPAAGVVSGALAFDLDDVGAEIGQNLPRPRTCQNAGKFEHAYSGQGTRHRLFLLPALRCWLLTTIAVRPSANLVQSLIAPWPGSDGCHEPVIEALFARHVGHTGCRFVNWHGL